MTDRTKVSITTRAVAVWPVLICAEIMHGITRDMYNVLAGGLLPSGMVVLLFAPLIVEKLRGTVPTR